MLKKILALLITGSMALSPITVFADSNSNSNIQFTNDTQQVDVVVKYDGQLSDEYSIPSKSQQIEVNGIKGFLLNNYPLSIREGYKKQGWKLDNEVVKVAYNVGGDKTATVTKIPKDETIEDLNPKVTPDNKMEFYLALGNGISLSTNCVKTDEDNSGQKTEMYVSIDGSEPTYYATVYSSEDGLGITPPKAEGYVFKGWRLYEMTEQDSDVIIKFDDNGTVSGKGHLAPFSPQIGNYLVQSLQSTVSYHLGPDVYMQNAKTYSTPKVIAEYEFEAGSKKFPVEIYTQFGSKPAKFYDKIEETGYIKSLEAPKFKNGYEFSHWIVDTPLIEKMLSYDINTNNPLSGFTNNIIQAGKVMDSISSSSNLTITTEKIQGGYRLLYPLDDSAKLTAVYKPIAGVEPSDETEQPATPTDENTPVDSNTTDNTKPTDDNKPKEQLVEKTTDNTKSTDVTVTPKNSTKEVKNDTNKGDEPQTGDNMNVASYVILSAISVICIVLMVRKNKKASKL